MLPHNLIDSSIIKSIETNVVILEKEKIKIVKHKKKVLDANAVYKVKEKSLKVYEKSSAFVKFFRRNFGDGDSEKRIKAFNCARTAFNTVSHQQMLIEMEYGALQQRVQKQSVLVTEHILKSIDADLNSVNDQGEPTIAVEAIAKLRSFVIAHHPRLLPQLDKKLDMREKLFSAISGGQPLARITYLHRLLSICHPLSKKTSDRLLSFLKGELFYENNDALKNDLISLLPIHNIGCDRLIETIKRRYLTPLLEKMLSAIEPNTATHDTTTASVRAILTFYTPIEQDELLMGFDQFGYSEKRLPMLLDCLPAFSNARHYADLRDGKLRDFFARRIESIFNNMSVYQHAHFMEDDFIFMRVANTLLPHEKKSIAETILDNAIKHHLSKAIKPTWNREFAVLVEKYGSADSINACRSLRLCELSESAQSGSSRAQDENAFLAFLSTCQKLPLSPMDLTTDQQAFIQKISSNPNASWMHEMIIRELGTKKQRQDMHARWLLTLLDSIDYNKTLVGEHEKVLRDLIQQAIVEPQMMMQLTAKERLIEFVGQNNMAQIKASLFRLLNTIDHTLFVPVVQLSTVQDINHIQVSRKQLDDMIRIMGGSIVETLLSVFSAENTKKYFIPSQANFIARLAAQRDLNAITKQFYHAISGGFICATTSEKMLDLAYTETVLLKRPIDRQHEKEGKRMVWLTMHFEPDERNDDPSTGDHPSSEMMTPVNFLQRLAKFEYNYHENPAIFYTHHRLPLLDFCHSFFTKKIAGGDIEQNTQLLSAITDSLFLLDARHIDPMISLFKKGLGESNIHLEKELSLFRDALIRLGKPYHHAENYKNELADCEKFLLQYQSHHDHQLIGHAIQGIQLYLQACKKTKVIRDLIEQSNILLSIEKAMDWMIDKKTPNIDILSAIKQFILLPSQTASLSNRIQVKLNALIMMTTDTENNQIIEALVTQFGTELQQETFQRLKNIASIQCRVGEKKFTSVGDNTASFFSDFKKRIGKFRDSCSRPSVMKSTIG